MNTILFALGCFALAIPLSSAFDGHPDKKEKTKQYKFKIHTKRYVLRYSTPSLLQFAIFCSLATKIQTNELKSKLFPIDQFSNPSKLINYKGNQYLLWGDNNPKIQLTTIKNEFDTIENTLKPVRFGFNVTEEIKTVQQEPLDGTNTTKEISLSYQSSDESDDENKIDDQ